MEPCDTKFCRTILQSESEITIENRCNEAEKFIVKHLAGLRSNGSLKPLLDSKICCHDNVERVGTDHPHYFCMDCWELIPVEKWGKKKWRSIDAPWKCNE